MSTIVVFVEHTGGNARRASLECLGAAHATGAQVVAVLTGQGAADCANTLGAAGASKAVVLTGTESYSPDATAKDVAAVIQDQGAKGFLAAASSTGKDLAPRVAALCDAVLFADCTTLKSEGDSFAVTRPWLAGKAIATCGSSAAVFCATTRPNVFNPVTDGGSVEVMEKPATLGGKATVIAIEEKPAGKLDVQEAPVVVSGGRGLKDAESFAILEALAAAFGGRAAVGASRAVVDAGWRPHSEQVGQTGKVVSPQLYIAVGISGAIQHLAGMRTSGTIVAINKDADAPIFKVADFGIVGDAFEVVPALTEAIQAVVSQS